MGVASIFSSVEEFRQIYNLSSIALVETDTESRERAIMRAFLSINLQMTAEGIPFEDAAGYSLSPYTKTSIETVVYKLLKKTDPLADLRSQLGDFEREIKKYPATNTADTPDNSDREERNASKVSAHEILPHLFLGNKKAAAGGVIHEGEHEGKPYDLMVKVTHMPVEFKPGVDVLDIGVDDSKTAWDKLVRRASGEYFYKTMPAEKWFKMAFDQIAVSLLKGKNVLLFCSYGVSRSATVAIAFLMRLFGARFLQATSYVQNIRTMIRPNQGFVDELFRYDALLHYSTHLTAPAKVASIKVRSIDELKKKFDERGISLRTYGLDAPKEPVGGSDEGISVNEILPRLFLGNEKAAENGTILFGGHKGEPYGLMVKVSTGDMTFRTDANVLDIGVDYSDVAWDNLVKKASGESFSPETPAEEWFAHTFGAIAISLLEEKNVLVFCSCGVSHAPIVAMAFLMRLFRTELNSAFTHIRHIRPMTDPDFGLGIGLRGYDTLLNQSSRTNTICLDSALP